MHGLCKSAESSIFQILLLVCGLSLGQKLDENITREFALFISPSQFENILTSRIPFRYEGDETGNESLTFLHTFTRFVLAFDFKLKSDGSFNQLKRICMATASYNEKQIQNKRTSNVLKIWIAIIPQDDVTGQLNLAVSVINETNALFAGTVRAFILHYRAQRLGPQSLPLLNQDIEISKTILNAQSPVAFGMILDVRNCYGSDQHFRNLLLAPLDLVMFMPFGRDVMYTKNLAINSMLPCAVRFLQAFPLNRLPLFGYTMYVTFDIDIDNRTFWINPTPLPEIVNLWNNEITSITILEPQTVKSNSTEAADPAMSTLESREKWLQQGSEFNEKYLGISVYDEYHGAYMESLTTSILETFCKMIVQQREQAASSLTNLELRLNQLLQYSESLHGGEKWSGKCGAGSPYDIMLSVNTYQFYNDSNFQDINKAIISNLTNIARMASVSYSNASLTLLFNWNTCFAVDGCEDSYRTKSETFEGSSYIHVFASFFDDVRKLVFGVKFHKPPKVGIVLNWQFCLNFLNQSYIYSAFKDVDTFVFKLLIHKQNITDRGALKTSTEIIPLLQLCSSHLEGLELLPDNRRIDFTYSYQIIMYGCDSTSTDLTELMEIVRFRELIGQWAVSVDTPVYLGSAVEDETTQKLGRDHKCTVNDAQDSLENCDCGWWRAVATTPEIETTDDPVTLVDKKSIANKIFQESPYKQSTRHPATTRHIDILLSVLVPLIIFSALFTSAALVLVIRYRNKHRLSSDDVESFFRGRGSTRVEAVDRDAEVCYAPHSQPYNRERYEIRSRDFMIDISKPLGCGKFSSVFRGTVRRATGETAIAVKMIKKLDDDRNHSNFLALKGLISEIKILSYVGNHKHVVGLIGAHTAKLKSGKLVVFLELCEMGSLFKFLRNYRVQPSHDNKSRVETDGESDHESECKAIRSELPKEIANDLHRWSLEIACGMEFLSTKNMVHADLATRNILLDSAKCAKISDFGLSRRFYDYTEYVKRDQTPMPWRWMSPESLRRMIFNQKTDVWSFGVTLWEMFTLGDEPYPGLSCEANFTAMLERGLRLEKPRHDKQDVYGLMKRCWNTDPAERPTFSDLTKILELNPYEIIY